MVKLTILSLNVRGLNVNIKRVKCQELMRRANADIVLIQESHLKQGDVQRMQNKQYMVVSSSSSGSSSKGVMIMFKRNLPMKIEGTSNDKSGRVAYVCTSIYGTKVAFISVYAPAVFEDSFYPDLTEELLKITEYELVLGGDMNAACNLDLDRSTSSFTHSQQSASTALNTMINNLNLFDVWRSQNPGSQDYTCFSAYHKSFSRIDYFLL